MTLTRRSFLAASAATVVAARSASFAAPRDANSRIGVCTIGFNGQGGSHIKDILKMKDEAEYVALCDVDSEVLERGAKFVEEAQGKRPKLYRDIREALADKSIDAVTIATPNHWHSLAAIWACQAGKDVYVEKPLCHNVYEGRQLVEAAKKYGKIVQHGTQNRAELDADPRHEADSQRLHRQDRRVARLRLQEWESQGDRPWQARASPEES